VRQVTLVKDKEQPGAGPGGNQEEGVEFDNFPSFRNYPVAESTGGRCREGSRKGIGARNAETQKKEPKEDRRWTKKKGSTGVVQPHL